MMWSSKNKFLAAIVHVLDWIFGCVIPTTAFVPRFTMWHKWLHLLLMEFQRPDTCSLGLPSLSLWNCSMPLSLLVFCSSKKQGSILSQSFLSLLWMAWYPTSLWKRSLFERLLPLLSAFILEATIWNNLALNNIETPFTWLLACQKAKWFPSTYYF